MHRLRALGGGTPANTTPKKRGVETEGDKEEAKKKKQEPTKGEPNAELLKRVHKAKALHHSMTSSVNTIIYTIQNKGKSWSWADHEQNLGSLRRCLEAVIAMLDSSDRDILVTDISVLKDDVGPEAFLNKLGHFLPDLRAFE